jgi:hypothetical protein
VSGHLNGACLDHAEITLVSVGNIGTAASRTDIARFTGARLADVGSHGGA